MKSSFGRPWPQGLLLITYQCLLAAVILDGLLILHGKLIHAANHPRQDEKMSQTALIFLALV